MKRILALLIAVLALACGIHAVVYAQEKKKIEPADVYVRSARIALQNKEYDRVEKNLRVCLENYPENYQAHFLMGAVWADKEQIDSMVAEFNLARRYAGKNLKKIEEDMQDIEESLWEQNFNSGVNYVNISDSLESASGETDDSEEGQRLRNTMSQALDESTKDFKNCTLIQPDEFRGWFNLGLAYDRKRDYAAAAEVYKISEDRFHRITMEDTTTDYYDTTLFFQGDGEPTDLFKEIKKKFKKKSEDMRTRYKGLSTALGGVYFELGEFENTIIIFRRLLGFFEEDLSALEYISNSFQQLGDNEEALKWVKLIIENNPEDKDRLYNVGAHYYNIGADDKKIYERLLKEKLQGSEDPNIDTEIAKAMERYRDKFTRALQYLEAVLELDSEDKDTWRLNGVILFFLEQYDDAIPVLEKAITLNPDDISLCQILAECYRQKGDVEKVLRLTEECGLGK
ncbi:tetratricopeptide repeat protein [Candidatus Zixiibacteriota bacterium]